LIRVPCLVNEEKLAIAYWNEGRVRAKEAIRAYYVEKG
jgi:hypothetical protein